jgi:hypothetical protein
MMEIVDALAGRAVCCDGSFSSSCGCHGDDIKEFTNKNESEKPQT